MSWIFKHHHGWLQDISHRESYWCEDSRMASRLGVWNISPPRDFFVPHLTHLAQWVPMKSEVRSPIRSSQGVRNHVTCLSGFRTKTPRSMVGPSMSSMPPWRGMQLEWFFKTWTSSNWTRTTLVQFSSRQNSRAAGRNQTSFNVLQRDATSSWSTSHILKGHVHVPHISWALFQGETGLLSVSLLEHIYLQEQIHKCRLTAEKWFSFAKIDSSK